MGRVKKFAAMSIRKITGGKDPVRLVEEFIVRRGFDPDECAREKAADSARWMVKLGEEEELEILAESLKVSAETTIYMGVNIATVPVRGGGDMLAAALEIADGLVGIKVSLVGHYLVLSSTLGASGITVEDLDYNFKLITAQQTWFREALADEMGWESLPED
ncbi:MAG: hypothetical protein RL417_2114 [Pseudomonadota bacterium]|jgi:hypothetical protein